MRQCIVCLPIVGMAYVEVEAETQEEAFKIAKDKATFLDIESFECYTNEITTPEGHTLTASVELEE